MKFREYDNLKSIVITSDDIDYFNREIEAVGNLYNIVDLQFSTDNVPSVVRNRNIVYHALLLVEC